MQQFFIGIILALGLSTWYLWNERGTLIENNAKLETAVETQQRTMDSMRESFERQGQSLNNLMARNAQIEQDMNRYLDIFRRHNLNQLAEARPGLVETTLNNGTKEVFEDIENDSREISNLGSNNNPN
jgi:uncharacterized protein YoxC